MQPLQSCDHFREPMLPSIYSHDLQADAKKFSGSLQSSLKTLHWEYFYFKEHYSGSFTTFFMAGIGGGVKDIVKFKLSDLR